MKARQLAVHRYGHSSTSKWVVDGWKENGKRKRFFFGSKEEAKAWADLKSTELANYGTKALTMPEELRLDAIKAAQRLAPYDRSLAEAANYFITHLESCGKSCDIQTLVDEFQESRRRKGRSSEYLRDLRSRLGRFAAAFGTRLAATITTRDIDLWIHKLGLGPQSQNNYRAVLSTLFTYGVSRGYATAHPVAAIEKAKVVSEPPGILIPDELSKVLHTALDIQPDLTAFLAIGAFAGLRMAELGRLSWNDLDLSGGYIHVSAKAAKTAQRRLVKIEPNLLAWLQSTRSSTGSVKPINCRSKLLRIRKKVELRSWPANCLRHSYASYHLAKFQDAPALALQMGHTTTEMLFAHYREVVTPQAAEQYWSIFPPSLDFKVTDRDLSPCRDEIRSGALAD